jgi:Zn-finger protein
MKIVDDGKTPIHFEPSNFPKSEYPEECGANGGQGCSYKPCGPKGEMQCEFCGSPYYRKHEHDDTGWQPK